jgi:hypothetical protein
MSETRGSCRCRDLDVCDSVGLTRRRTPNSRKELSVKPVVEIAKDVTFRNIRKSDGRQTMSPFVGESGICQFWDSVKGRRPVLC